MTSSDAETQSDGQAPNDATACDADPSDSSFLSLWSADFASGQVMDPEEDDTGDGDYTYPAGVPAGSVDLRSFSLAYSATSQTLSLSIGLRAITDHTRVGVLLLDETGFKQGAYDWTVGGTEIRAPLWNGHGVNMILADPDSMLFDFNATHPNPTSERRPDNVIYVHHDPTQWLGDLGASTALSDLKRLYVTKKNVDQVPTLEVTVPAADVAPYLDTKTPKLYVLVYAYLVIDDRASPRRMEYGAYEVTEAENANSEWWADCDAYDVAFVDGNQAALLTVRGNGTQSPETDEAVHLTRVGEGVLEITTSP
ncbi:MAG: hypothetical protein JRH20_07845 [Deltaproteobacteria bacterium]|nr:hypothetical protein [Deltaproteobacteria bacterium]